MPELPEVETLRRGLSAGITDRYIVSMRVLDSKIVTGPQGVIERDVAGRRIDRVARRGKVLILYLQGSGSLLIHPRMTGQLVVTVAGATMLAGGHPTPSLLQPMPNKTTRAILWLDEATCLYYNDARRFGWIRLASARPCTDDPFLRRLGLEPLAAAFTVAALREGLSRHARAPVKAALLNQTVVAGIGNIYADESLHHSRIYPGRHAGDLSQGEIGRLRPGPAEVHGVPGRAADGAQRLGSGHLTRSYVIQGMRMLAVTRDPKPRFRSSCLLFKRHADVTWA